MRCYNQPMIIEERLAQIGLSLPELVMPVGNYLPYKVVNLSNAIPPADWPDINPVAGGMLYISGMIPMQDGAPFTLGKLGADVSLEDGVTCAQLCTLNALSWASAALDGNLDRIIEVVQVRGHVASTPEFYDQAKVINGCSDLLVEIFGDDGKHSRIVVGCPALPLNVPVEIDFIFSLR
jgi:enamine deaminase RidA (YjgF/YER057c/UK114 family)